MHSLLGSIFVSFNKSGDIYNACLILQDGKLRKIKLVTVLKRRTQNSKDSKRASSQRTDILLCQALMHSNESRPSRPLRHCRISGVRWVRWCCIRGGTVRHSACLHSGTGRQQEHAFFISNKSNEVGASQIVHVCSD
jgi:hypothetical protein